MIRTTVAFQEFVPDRSSPVPLHLQMSSELLRQLRALPPNGEYRLPSERSLVESLGIDRSTVHRAYAELLESGLVVRNPDKSLSVASGVRKQLQGAFPMIGVVVPERFSDYIERHHQRSLRYLKGMMDRAAERQVSTLMVQLPPPEAPSGLVESFIAERCAPLTGLIHLGDRGEAEDATLRRVLEYRGIPQIFISGDSDLPHIGSVSGDPVSGARELCAELRRLGCRTVGMVVEYIGENPENFREFRYSARKRFAVMFRELSAVGFEFPERWRPVYIMPESDLKDVLSPLLVSGDVPDFLWCSNDFVARNVVEVLNQAGLRVPEDVSVAGFDGVFSGLDSGLRPATIRQPFYHIGAKAVDLLLEHFENGITAVNRNILLPTEFVPGITLRNNPFPKERK